MSLMSYKEWLRKNFKRGTKVLINGNTEYLLRVEYVRDGKWDDGSEKWSLAFFFQDRKVIKEYDLGQAGLPFREGYSRYLLSVLSFDSFLNRRDFFRYTKRDGIKVKFVEYSSATNPSGEELVLARLTFDDGVVCKADSELSFFAFEDENLQHEFRHCLDFVGEYFGSFLRYNTIPDWYSLEHLLLKDNTFLAAVINRAAKTENVDLNNPKLRMFLLCWSHPVVTYSYAVTLVNRNGVLGIEIYESEND